MQTFLLFFVRLSVIQSVYLSDCLLIRLANFLQFFAPIDSFFLLFPQFDLLMVSRIMYIVQLMYKYRGSIFCVFRPPPPTFLDTFFFQRT